MKTERFYQFEVSVNLSQRSSIQDGRDLSERFKDDLRPQLPSLNGEDDLHALLSKIYGITAMWLYQVEGLRIAGANKVVVRVMSGSGDDQVELGYVDIGGQVVRVLV